tara:strand:- start:974 stop:1252 length:279 start_codon:yes stop_codon:yes gene_type:complete
MSDNTIVEKGDIIVAPNGVFQVREVDHVRDLIHPISMSPADSLMNESFKSLVVGHILSSFSISHAKIVCKKHDFYEKHQGDFTKLLNHLIKK